MKAIIQDGEILGVIELDPKTFKTGSKGYHGIGKIVIRGKKYQANFMLIEIGSKNKK